MEAETLLAIMTIKYRTATARIAHLEAQMKDAGIPTEAGSSTGASGGSSFDLPESTLLRSRPPTTTRSGSTSKPPAGDLG